MLRHVILLFLVGVCHALSPETIEQVEAELEDSVNQFMVDLQRGYEVARHRTRRSIGSQSTYVDVQNFTVETVYENKPNIGYSSLFYHEPSSVYYHLTVTESGTLEIFLAGNVAPVATLDLGRDITAVEGINGKGAIADLVIGTATHGVVYTFNPGAAQGMELELKQSLPVQRITDITFVSGRSGETYCVVTSDTAPALEVYLYTSAGMDRVSQYPHSCFQRLEHFQHRSRNYIVAQSCHNGVMNSQADVVVFRLDDVEGSLLARRVQSLSVTAPVGLSAFTVDGSTYLFAGSGISDESMIFWWTYDQFLVYQSLSTALNENWGLDGVTDVDSISLPGGEVLLLATLHHINSQGLIMGMIQDYSSGMFVHAANSFTTAASPNSLYTWVADAGTMLTYYAAESYEDVEINFFTMQVEMPSLEPTDMLLQCMYALQEDKADQQALLDDIDTTLQHTIGLSTNQTIDSDVVIDDIDIASLTVPEVEIVTSAYTPGDSVYTILDLKNGLDAQAEEISVITIDLAFIVMKGAAEVQTVAGEVTFTGDVVAATLTTPNVTVAGSVSGVSPVALDSNVLKRDEDQTITAAWAVTGDLTLGTTEYRSTWNAKSLSDLMLTNVEQNVTGVTTFHQDVMLGGSLTASTLNGFTPETDFVTAGSSQAIAGRKTVADVLMTRSDLVAPSLNTYQLDLKAEDMVTLNGAHSTITADVTFNGGVNFDTSVTMSGDINGVNLVQLAAEVLDLTSEQEITGEKTINGGLTLTGNLVSIGDVNGIDMAMDVVHLSGEQDVTSPLTLAGDETTFNAAITTDSVAGSVLTARVVTLAGAQTIDGVITFNGAVDVAGDVILADGDTINSIDVSALDAVTVKVDESADIYGDKTFSDIVATAATTGTINAIDVVGKAGSIWRRSTNDTIDVNVTVNNNVVTNSVAAGSVNLFDLANDFVTLAGDQTITGEVTFTDDLATASIDIADTKTVDGVDLSDIDSRAVKLATDQVITAAHTFGDLNFTRDVSVGGTLNSIDTSDIMLADAEQTVTGTKTFGAVTATGTLTADTIAPTTVNGVDISTVAETAVMINDTTMTISGDVSFESLSISGNMSTSGLVDGVDLLNLRANAVTIDGSQTITGAMSFDGPVTFSSVASDNVNNVNFTSLDINAFRIASNEVLTGTKTFTGPVVITSDLDSTVDDIDIGTLESTTMSKSKVQSGGTKTFTSSMTIDQLTVLNLIDGINLDNSALLDADNTFSKTFTISNDLQLQDMDVNVIGNLNGASLTSFNSVVIRKDEASTVMGAWVFENATLGCNATIAGTVNDVDIDTLYAEYMSKTAPNVVPGEKTFTKVTTFTNVDFTGTVNLLDLDAIYSDIVSKSEAQIIDGDKVLVGNHVVAGVLTITDSVDVGLVNDYDLLALQSQTVYTMGNQSIGGFKTYAAAATTSFEELTVAGTVDGIVVPDQLVLRDTDESVEGATMLADVVADTLTAGGYVDGENVTMLVAEFVYLSGEQTIAGAMEFTSAVDFTGSIVVNGTVNSIDVGEDLFTASGDQLVSGAKTFAETVTCAELTPLTINDVDVQWLYDHAVLTSAFSAQQPTVSFNGNITFAANVIIQESVSTVNLVNNADLSEMSVLQKWKQDYLPYAMGVLETEVATQGNIIGSVVNASTGMIDSAYGYFELVGEIGTTSYGGIEVDRYYDPTTVYWWQHDGALAAQYQLPDHADQCHAFETMNASMSNETYGNESTATPGRLFFHDMPADNAWIKVISYGISSNPWCVTGVIYPGDNKPVEIIVRTSNGAEVRSNVPPTYIGDVKVLKVPNGDVYLIIAKHFEPQKMETRLQSNVFKVDLYTGVITKVMDIQTYGSVDISSASNGNDIYFAIANQYDSRTESYACESHIYKYANATSHFVKVKTVYTETASNAELFFIDGLLYAFFANEKRHKPGNYYWNNLYSTNVAVYQQIDPEGPLMQTGSIPIQGVRDLETFKIADEQFVTITSHKDGAVYLLRYSYSAGFNVVQVFPNYQATSTIMFWQGGDLFLVVAADIAPTRIYRAFIRGPKVHLPCSAEDMPCDD
ncbi:PREDICTED: uncharacterized protein LOC106813723 [Priapulus caudatus]|uniref:Uncharacterized protein LOC106813723 n=1 Tax=Priapulus caudatus TaxID=37621 RepID=A0ABM1EMJ8_PRICU|nr:PREDICTED: uncharacterized protein LOC106813723 [Priapulus caudatus]